MFFYLPAMWVHVEGGWCSVRYGKSLGLIAASKTEEARHSLLTLLCKARLLCQKQQRQSVESDLGESEL